MKTAEDVLRDAADLVGQGWCQGQGVLKDESGQIVAVCLEQAILNAAGKKFYFEQQETYYAIWAAIAQEIGVRAPLEVPMWNDMPGRTKEEVATALRNAKRFL